jgi:nitrite reductase/ring-hydroxylating ferredoxin subunit
VEKEVAMGQFVKVGTVADFKDVEGGKLVDASGRSLGIFRVGANYYAIDNTCTHRGGHLAESMLVGEEVICPWHGAHFNVKTGAVCAPPAREGVKKFSRTHRRNTDLFRLLRPAGASVDRPQTYTLE